jgi:hypothetical protein
MSFRVAESEPGTYVNVFENGTRETQPPDDSDSFVTCVVLGSGLAFGDPE